MHHLGVPTTRALCLVASKSEFVERAWFKSDTYSEQYNFPPNFMIKERCAITTRAASSFLRVGQIELFSRKVRNGDEGALEEMKKFLMYCFKREFPDLYEHESQDMKPQQLAQQTIKFLKLFSKRQAALVAAWLRVGYVQGNMNSDNCLLAGITMDYGPFGFVEKYDPLWTPFTSDPQQNFGFERQLLASYVNFATLTKALMPIFEDSREMIDELQDVLQNDCKRDLLEARDLMRQRKLGLSDWSDAANQNLWSPLYEILPGMDYIIFWRELSQISLKTLQTFTEEEVARIFGRAAYDLDLFYAEKKQKKLLLCVEYLPHLGFFQCFLHLT
ncbi:protein adenylyltransferase SelO-like [Zophobas morio]|uniref:protein adenylyltransferase SelO-like n=1 Tax=Zophobas morio TaxID=2755281 RepID=UPI003083C684